jgi:ornithine cyclodeaminase/alanine dehydrogenase-like protein (mu-crystallin family)
MKVLIINQAEVHQLLPIGECMEVMAAALRALSQGKAINPLRQILHLPNKPGLLGIMPGYVEGLNAVGLKVVSVFHNNRGTEHDSHQGAVLVFEADHGCLKAMVDASAITSIRTAAVSGVATRLLAREDAAELAILGSGVQAHAHVNAMLEARSIVRVRVWSPNPDHVKAFVRDICEQQDITVIPTTSAQEAVKGADIVCTTTSAREPVLMGEWLAPGVHINAVGSSMALARELDAEAVAKSRLFVDRRESTVNEAGDYLMARKEGTISDHHIQGEIGEILAGQIAGRQSEDEITLFKSLGLAVEDIASAHFVYQKAMQSGLGTWVEFGGDRRVPSLRRG